MKRVLYNFFGFALISLAFSACLKKEQPLKVPEAPQQTGDFEIKNSQVSMGEKYETQIYFSLNNGIVQSGPVAEWDINLTTAADNNELRLNGGKRVLIHATGNTNFAAINTVANIAEGAWLYDNSGELPGTSGLGYLHTNNRIGEVLIVDDGDKNFYKIQILENTANAYKVKIGKLSDATGQEYVWEKDNNYNFVYYSFAGGLVKPEPPKTDWDLVFTRYRHIYYAYNDDGSDFLYQVTGVLSNPYMTQCGEDTLTNYEFYDFDIEQAQKYTFFSDRDVIGFDWKNVNINTGAYTVNAKSIFVIQDQKGGLWKLHFVGFYDDGGIKGSPKFEFQQLQ